MLLMNSRKPFPLPRARGFSLIEVLVSIFIVSLGVLALGGLLQSASRYGKMSEVRSMATLLANDIADRIHANASDFGKNYAFGSDQSFPTSLPTAAQDCIVTNQCSVSKLAQRDLYAWTTRLRSMLPDGSAYIKFNSGTTSNGAYDVWVAWRDPSTTANGSTERPDSECPQNWSGASDNKSVRCVYIQVGL
jgi:type IV pilus assembly protein PilV